MTQQFTMAEVNAARRNNERPYHIGTIDMSIFDGELEQAFKDLRNHIDKEIKYFYEIHPNVNFVRIKIDRDYSDDGFHYILFAIEEYPETDVEVLKRLQRHANNQETKSKKKAEKERKDHELLRKLIKDYPDEIYNDS